MKLFSGIKKLAFLAAVVPMVSMSGAVVFADDATPGQAGQTKINIYDNTHDGWNVTVGTPDPIIGFVNFRPTVEGDLTHVKVVVALKDGAPSCDYDIQLVTSGNNDDAGLAPDGTHTGSINNIGTMTTNAQGKANSGEITVDVTTLFGVAATGSDTYAHVDLEDGDGDCMESDGSSVENNEYGASGKQPSSTLALPVNMHWTQP